MWVSEIRQKSRSMESDGVLSQLELVLCLYHDEHNAFPPNEFSETKSAPQHSWRVLLVKYMNDEEFHSLYSFDKAWNSEENLAIARENIEAAGSFQGGFNRSQDSPFTDFFAGNTKQIDEYSNRGWKTRLVEKEGDEFLLVEVPNSKVHWLSPLSELEGVTLN